MTLPHSVSRFAFFLLFVAWTLAFALHTPAEAATGLTFSPSTVRFGGVVVGQSETLSASVSNSAASSITISSITGSTGEYTVSYPTLPLTLAPGQSASLSITFTPSTAGSNSGTIAINGGAANLDVHGWGTSDSLVSNPASISFGNVAVGGTSQSYITLTNNRNGNVTIGSEQTSGSAFTVIGLTTPLTLTPGQSYTFTVDFSPQAAGAFKGAVAALNSKGGPILTIPLSGNGAAAGQLSLSPTSVSFGNVNVGSNLSKAITLTASGSSVTVSSVSSSNSEFSISGLSLPVTIPAGQSVSYSVVFTPRSGGSASSTLSFATNASNAVSESLTGTGLSPTYNVSLTWDASTSSVSGYNVYRGTISGGPYAKMNSVVNSTTSYMDPSVAASSTYYYVTTAVSSTGQESGYSNQVQVVVP